MSYENIIKCVEEHFKSRFTFISTVYLHSHAPSFKNNLFSTKMEITICDNFDNQIHTIRVRHKTNDILINKLNRIIQSKRDDTIDGIIN
jgi:hypothetical protein